jgi:hypothetical protein
MRYHNEFAAQWAIEAVEQKIYEKRFWQCISGGAIGGFIMASVTAAVFYFKWRRASAS